MKTRKIRAAIHRPQASQPSHRSHPSHPSQPFPSAGGALSTEEQAAFETCAARAEAQGATLDKALLQCIRERLWRALREECDPQIIRAFFPHWVAGRRQALAEHKMLTAENDRSLSAEEERKQILKLFGAPPCPAHADVNDVSADPRHNP